LRGADVGTAEQGMRVRAAGKGRVEHSGDPEVVEVGAPSRQETRILDPLDPRAGEAGSPAHDLFSSRLIAPLAVGS
jgi:hypothetical protein